MTSATDEAQPGLAAAAVVIAQQAGTDTWKTWAGRKDGEDDFQFGDLWNGVAAGWRHMIRRRKGDKVRRVSVDASSSHLRAEVRAQSATRCHHLQR